MWPLCYGMRSYPFLLSLSTCLLAVAYLSFVLLSADCLVVLIQPKLLPWSLVGSASVTPAERCVRTCKLFGQRQGVRLDELSAADSSTRK